MMNLWTCGERLEWSNSWFGDSVMLNKGPALNDRLFPDSWPLNSDLDKHWVLWFQAIQFGHLKIISLKIQDLRDLWEVVDMSADGFSINSSCFHCFVWSLNPKNSLKFLQDVVGIVQMTLINFNNFLLESWWRFVPNWRISLKAFLIIEKHLVTVTLTFDHKNLYICAKFEEFPSRPFRDILLIRMSHTGRQTENTIPLATATADKETLKCKGILDLWIILPSGNIWHGSLCNSSIYRFLDCHKAVYTLTKRDKSDILENVRLKACRDEISGRKGRPMRNLS